MLTNLTLVIYRLLKLHCVIEFGILSVHFLNNASPAIEVGWNSIHYIEILHFYLKKKETKAGKTRWKIIYGFKKTPYPS